MNITELELSEKELEDIINQIPDGKILVDDEGYKDVNVIDIDHYYIKSIDCVFYLTPMKSYPHPSEPEKRITPLKLKITNCICYNEDLVPVDISNDDEKMIVTAMNHRYDIEDDVI